MSVGSVVLRMAPSPPFASSRLRSADLLGASRQQVANFFVGRLCEILVPEADRMKGLRRHGTDDIVGLLAQLLAGLGWRDRDRHDEARRPLLPQRLDGSLHGGSVRQAVI